jgi:hypothetical protein
MPDEAEFSWSDDESVVIDRVDAIAVYTNAKGDLVIRQEHPLGDDDSTIIVPRRRVGELTVALKREAQDDGQTITANTSEPKRNPTIPELPEVPPSLEEALNPLFEPAIPELNEFLAEGWWKNKPDEADSHIRMLWLRYRQTATALAAACAAIVRLQHRVELLETKQDPTIQ